MIVDYKTGGKGKNTADLHNKYQRQLTYYALALNGILNQPVKEAYLFMLDDARIIAVK